MKIYMTIELDNGKFSDTTYSNASDKTLSTEDILDRIDKCAISLKSHFKELMENGSETKELV